MTQNLPEPVPDKVRKHYATSDRLDVRIKTHEKYTQPKINFPEWILNRIIWHGSETILDVGCGSGIYASPAKARGGHYIAADISMGMLRNLADKASDRVNLDALALPFKVVAVDVILANHMLYHVPDLAAVLAEFARVLKPGGKLIAATNSESFKHQIHDVLNEASVTLGGGRLDNNARRDFIWPFTLENGKAQLEKTFSHIDLYELHTELVFPSADPVLAYIDSADELYRPHLKSGLDWSNILRVVEELIQDRIDSDGQFIVSKHNGAFVCQK